MSDRNCARFECVKHVREKRSVYFINWYMKQPHTIYIHSFSQIVLRKKPHGSMLLLFEQFNNNAVTVASSLSLDLGLWLVFI